jgi:hypothetical protein
MVSHNEQNSSHTTNPRVGRFLLVVNVQDTTASNANVDRGSMHVVEHPDDLFSWDKYNNCTFNNNIS